MWRRGRVRPRSVRLSVPPPPAPRPAGRHRPRARGPGARPRARLPAAPARRALLGEGAHALAQVVGVKAGPPQLDELALDVGVEVGAGAQQLADHALVAAHAE